MRLPEIDYEKLNPGIRKVVKWLRDHHFDTCDSGDGVTHEFECDRDHPYVVLKISGAPDNFLRSCTSLLFYLRQLGVKLYPIGEMGPGKPSAQASLDLADGHPIIDLMWFTDKDLEAAQRANKEHSDVQG